MDDGTMSFIKRILELLERVETLLTRLGDAETALDRIQQKMEKIIMAEKTVADLLTEIDGATTAVAKRIQGLIDQLSNDTTVTELAAAKAGLQAEVDRLTAMGTGGVVDPNNP